MEEIVRFRIQRKITRTVLDPGCEKIDLRITRDQLLGIAYFTYCCGHEFRLIIDDTPLDEWLSEYQQIVGYSHVYCTPHPRHENAPVPHKSAIPHKYMIGLLDNYIHDHQVPANVHSRIPFDRIGTYLTFDTVSFLQGMKAVTQWLSLPTTLDLYQVREVKTGKMYHVRW